MQVNPKDIIEVGHLNAAIEHQGPNRQYVVLQTPAEYEGKKFKLLIDSGATHSFISPAAIVKLNPIDKPPSSNEPEWLSEYADIFPEELT